MISKRITLLVRVLEVVKDNSPLNELTWIITMNDNDQIEALKLVHEFNGRNSVIKVGMAVKNTVVTFTT